MICKEDLKLIPPGGFGMMMEMTSLEGTYGVFREGAEYWVFLNFERIAILDTDELLEFMNDCDAEIEGCTTIQPH